MADTNKNALAELAEGMKNEYVSLVVNGKQTATFALWAFPKFNKAVRIIEELAKIQEEETALFSMPNLKSDEAQTILRQRVGNCVLKCRAIAAEGSTDERK